MHQSKSTIKSITIRGMVVFGLYWIGYCSYIAFTVTTLLDYGWSDSAATGVMTLMSVITLLTQPMLGFISDRQGSVKRQVILILLLGSLSLFLLPLSLGSGSRILSVLNLTFTTFTICQTPGILDAWIVGLSEEFPSLNYGLFRGSGSFTYAIASQLMGIATIRFGIPVRFAVGGFFNLLAFLIALTIRDVHLPAKSKDETQLTGKTAFKLLFSSRKYCLLLAVAFCSLLGTVSLMTLLQLCIRDFGGTTADVGTVAAISALSEVPCMFCMAYFIRKYGASKMIVVASFFYAVRVFLSALAGSSAFLIGVQALQGLTYAVMAPAAMNYLPRSVDERVRSIAVTIYAAVTGSVTSIIGNLITTLLLAAGVSAQSAIAFFGIFSLTGFILAVVAKIRRIW